MMDSLVINLAEGREVDPDRMEDLLDQQIPEWWWVDDNRVTVGTERSVTVYTLPRRQRRVSYTRLGAGRAQLSIGGHRSLVATVTGPAATVKRLREAVL